MRLWPHLKIGKPPTDPTLQNPNCVLNILRRHFARYTPETVADICGCTREQFLDVAEQMMANSGRERTSAIVYAVGWTQHTTGVQIIRTAAILQLLLGNIGRPGGGIMAMRGHASIQGSTDIPTLYNLLPGYIPQPAKSSQPRHACTTTWSRKRSSMALWANFRQVHDQPAQSLVWRRRHRRERLGLQLVATHYRGPLAAAEFIRMAEGKVQGLFLIGQNPAVGAPNARLNRQALRQLKWLVVRDWFLIESATFWKEGPDNPDPSDRSAPRCSSCLPPPAAEKPGSLTNTERLLQWHEKAVDPPGDCRSDLWFIWNLGRRLKKLYAGSTAPRDQGLLNLTWDYAQDEPEILPDGRPQPPHRRARRRQRCCRRSTATAWPTANSSKSYNELKDDGSTACGCWIYCGVYPEEGRNRANERVADPEAARQSQLGLGLAGQPAHALQPRQRRPRGQSLERAQEICLVGQGARQQWTGLDTPDFEPTKSPDYRAEHRTPRAWISSMATRRSSSSRMAKAGSSRPAAPRMGPLPTHYEPVESPVDNALYKQRINPTAQIDVQPMNPTDAHGPGLPHRGHNFPGHRALSRRRHEPLR